MKHLFEKKWDSFSNNWVKVLEFKINEHLSLKLQNQKTMIYVNEEPFEQCKFLLFNLSQKEIPNYEDIKSIDEIERHYSRAHEQNHEHIDPETEFWGHCSNLQAWYEHNYDTNLLHSNLAFPLLKKLT